jgi:hypothetical protein
MVNSKGREANGAQPLGERKGLVSNSKTKKIGRKEARSAGPDGPSGEAVGDTFKR